MFSFESALFIGWALAVVFCDWRRRSIPNLLVLAGGVAAFVSAAMGVSPFGTTFKLACIGACAGAIALLPFYLLSMMGAADVKAFAALGAWCGPRALVGIWVAASLAACLHALYLLSRRRSSRPAFSLRDLPADAGIAEKRRHGTAYGALLAAAAIGQFALHAWQMQGGPG